MPASMLIFLAISLTLLVKVPVEGERCGTNNLGFRCQDNGECWEEEFVCDGYEQCADGSDEGTAEGQGCNLYPDSGCVSNNGKEHYKCKRTQECFNSKEDAGKCDSTTVIDGGACGLVLAANSVMFLTILGFFLAFDSEDVEYSVW